MTSTSIDKDQPPADWIEDLREHYTVEQEIDRVLVRKLNNRAGPAYSPQPLHALIEGTKALIKLEHEGEFELRDARWLTGGTSKLQMAFNLQWRPDGENLVETSMVLRMEPAASTCETSRLREYQLLKAFKDEVPLPTPYWVDVHGDCLPYPALIYGFSEGVTKPSQTVSNVSGLGTNLGPELRERLAPQFIEQLALIHNHDIHDPVLSAFDIPREPTTAALWAVDWWERVWEEDSRQDVPLMRLAAAWDASQFAKKAIGSQLSMRITELAIFFFNEQTAKITAWLDWELGHIGDRHEDLAWSMSRAFGHYDESGERFLTCGLLPEEEFLERYEAAFRLSVNRSTLHFYRVLSAYKAIVIVLGAGYRVAKNGKSHQDVLLTWLTGLASVLLDDLCILLEEVI